MITLFTTTKDFTGQNRINQLNAIRSWLNSSFNPQVIIFGKSEGSEELPTHPNLLFVDQVRLSETGAPMGNEMFDAINSLAKHEICCYVNADILLPSIFFKSAQFLNDQLKRNYLIVGERLDGAIPEEISFTKDWEKMVGEKYAASFKIHPPAGSDFFLYPKGQYNLSNTPVFYIGRGGWDNWMLYNARCKGYKVIDLSSTVRVIHLNHDYAHKSHPNQVNLEQNEIEANIFEVPSVFISSEVLRACNYFFYNNRLLKNFARGNWDKYVTIQQSLGQFNLFARLQIKALRIIANINTNLF